MFNMMASQPKNVRLPLKNIMGSFNTSSMDDGDKSYFSGLTSSPMSNLAFNLSELSTGRCTPRRKLSLTIVDTPPNNDGGSDSEHSQSVESDCMLWSPTADSSSFDSIYSDSNSTVSTLGLDDEADETLTVGIQHRSKLSMDDACSQDSGLGFEQDRRNSVSNFDDTESVSSSSSLDRLPSLEDVWSTLDSPGFKTPKGMPPKRTRSLTDNKHISEDTCSPIKYSPVKSSLPRPSFSDKLFFSQVSQDINEGKKFEANDGFQELFQLDNLQNEADDKLSSLINATLLHHPCEDKPDELTLDNMPDRTKKVKFSFGHEHNTPLGRPTVARRVLHRSLSLDIRPRPSVKRCDPPNDNTNASENKKWRGDDESLSNKLTDIANDSRDNMMVSARFLYRSHSETEAMIKSAISRMYSEPDLIGDCSKTYCLPTVSGRHQDLKSISPETLSQLIGDEFSGAVDEYHIIDCRYPYEYEGGHIQNAVNIYTKEEVLDKYIKSPVTVQDPSKRLIIIFHCEFSSERGPGLFRFLRRQDREANKERYPFLHYPEMYLLEGGYKSFFEHYSDLCEPTKYKTMLDKNHSEDLRKFRAKCKSWSDDKTQPRTGVRNIKF
uniref:M-phase inducer phosphatase n=1 Tax=Arion vulgaris TaxID=1028688 RepID=A0A0B6ZIW9_9EUPU